MKTIRGKKGVIAGALSDFWSYVVFILLVIIFFSFFKLQTGQIENNIKGIESKNKSDLVVLTYLKNPIEADIYGEKQITTIADIIIQHNTNKDFKTADLQKILSENTEKIFNSNYNNLRWRIIVSDKEDLLEKGIILLEGESKRAGREAPSVIEKIDRSCIILPNLDQSKNPIKVDMVLVNLFDYDSNARIREGYQLNKYKELSC